MRQVDYLIIGQGIAGTALALNLVKRGKRVLVIDNTNLSSCSKIAAGVFNPFNFRRLMNNWRAGEFVESASQLYREVETFPGEILRPRKLMKIFTSDDEWRLWERACLEKDGLFANENRMENPFRGKIHAPFGIGIVHNAGNIDSARFLQIARQQLVKADALLDENFDSGKLILTDSGMIYDGKIESAKAVFCEGHLVRKNPWFGFIPIYPVKGQVMQIRIPGLQLDEIISRGVYLLPLGEELFLTGATYQNDQEDEEIRADAEEELTWKLKKFLLAPFEIEKQFAGLRPAVRDRRPVLGKHPEFPQLSVFNGLGSKGVLLAPGLSEKLIEHLEEEKALPEEVRIERFARLRV